MCRLFGFRSVISSQVHQSLVHAENALMRQSDAHPDGWGVAYYVAGTPHVVKSARTAVSDQLFRHVSGIVSSETVVAHLRRATVGELSLINSHPFQYGNWIFAHNGNIPDFDEHRQALLAKIPPVMRRFILGNTDSEVLFYLLLGHMARRSDLHRKGYLFEDVAGAIEETIEDIVSLVDLNCYDDENKLFLSFLITNGETLVAHNGGKPMLYSTYKKRCSERDTCPNFSPECEAPPATGFATHMIISSEQLQGQNVWHDLKPGYVVGVDWRMQLKHFPLSSSKV
jgi:glutamine amidotransferase